MAQLDRVNLGGVEVEVQKLAHTAQDIDNVIIGENARIEAEARRVTAEHDRVNAETGRAAAEHDRAAAEQSRANAENDRSAGEVERILAESSRESAEEARILAEQKRETAEQVREDTTAGIVAQATEQAQLAQEARLAIENMWMEVVGVDAGQPATVSKELVDGVVRLVLSLPAGPQGEQGDTGISIRSIDRTEGTGAPGTVDTYTISLTDDSTTTFQVYNGKDGTDGDKNNLPLNSEVTMVSLGFEAKSTVSIGDFLKALRTQIGLNSFVSVRWQNNAAATVSNGSDSVEINGGFLLTNGQGNINDSIWSSYICLYIPLNSPVIYRFSARTIENAGTLNSVSMERFSPADDSNGTDGTGAKPVCITLSLPAAGWIDNEQTVQNPSLVAEGYSYILSPEPSSLLAYAAVFVYADDVTTDGQITFHAAQAPETDLTVTITRIEVS